MNAKRKEEEAEDDVLMRLLKDSMVVYKHLEDSLSSYKSQGMSIFGIQTTQMAHELNSMHLWRDDDDQYWSRYNSGNGGYERDLDIGIKPIQQRWPRLSVQPNPIYKWIPCQLGRDALRQFIKVNAVRCHPVKS